MTLNSRNGFTLLELVVVVTLILAIMSFAYPRMGKLRHTTYTDAVANDLRNLVQAQELFFNAYNEYADDEEDPLLTFETSEKVVIEIEPITTAGWVATGQYVSRPTAYCAVFVGEIDPDVLLGATQQKILCAEN